ncbi:MAG: hypothetical protein WBA07_00410, partial [Rivularia sp. (in: cyanobacteria)]
MSIGHGESGIEHGELGIVKNFSPCPLVSPSPHLPLPPSPPPPNSIYNSSSDNIKVALGVFPVDTRYNPADIEQKWQNKWAEVG